ncbi:MAG: L-glyceraldehyde 3-phosphate reductase [Micrococcales bacterium]
MDYVAAENRYEQLSYRRSGKSGLKLPELSLGLWHNFGDVDDFEVQGAILRRAFDLGITHFDLANNYGPTNGSAEMNFGKHLARDFGSYRDELIISSKAGYYMWPGPYGEWGSRKNLLSSLDQSLKRMQLDYVDIFYSHRFDPNTPLEETMGALISAVHQGKALYVGVSNYNPEQTKRAQELLAAANVPLLINQPKYSMFDRTIETSGLLDDLGANGIGCIVYSPLAQGLLTDRYLKGIPADSRAAREHFLKSSNINEVYLSRATALNEIAAARGQSLAQMALAWILRHSQMTSALIGASSVGQLEQNFAALSNKEFSREELSAIDEFAIHGTGEK